MAGLMWQGTPAALTPTNFTIMFPDGITPVASERFEIHLPGFGGAYNSFGATATSTVLRGNFLPSQNGIKAAKGTVMGGQQVCNQTFRPDDDGK